MTREEQQRRMLERAVEILHGALCGALRMEDARAMADEVLP